MVTCPRLERPGRRRPTLGGTSITVDVVMRRLGGSASTRRRLDLPTTMVLAEGPQSVLHIARSRARTTLDPTRSALHDSHRASSNSPAD